MKVPARRRPQLFCRVILKKPSRFGMFNQHTNSSAIVKPFNPTTRCYMFDLHILVHMCYDEYRIAASPMQYILFSLYNRIAPRARLPPPSHRSWARGFSVRSSTGPVITIQKDRPRGMFVMLPNAVGACSIGTIRKKQRHTNTPNKTVVCHTNVKTFLIRFKESEPSHA